MENIALNSAVQSSLLVGIDTICDRLPIISTISNLINLIAKIILKCFPNYIINNSLYWTYIKEKDLFRCIRLLIPIIGNVYIAVSDSSVYEEKERKKAINCVRANTAKAELALAGYDNVDRSELMPAPIEQQELLITHCFNKNVIEVEKLLREDFSPNFSHLGNTPLVYICTIGHLKLAQTLVNFGADINKSNALGITPVMAACREDHVEVFNMLLKSGQKIVQTEYQLSLTPTASIKHMSLLSYAACLSPRCALSLVENADVQCFDSSYQTVLHYALKDENLLKAVLLKCSSIEFVDYQNIVGETALTKAIKFDQEDQALFLLNRGADPFIPDGYRGQLFMSIDRSSNRVILSSILEIILDYVIHPDLENGKKSKTALIYACEKRFFRIITYVETKYSERITDAARRQIEAAKVQKTSFEICFI